MDDPKVTSACPNCGSPEIGKYCSNCGQRMAPVTLSVGKLLRDVLEDQFSLTSAFPRTMRELFFRPGFLTTEYLALRITRYIPPFRLYLVASVLFFLLASFLSRRANIDINTPGVQAGMDSARAEMARDTAANREPRRRARIGVTGDGGRENWLDSVDVNLGNDRLNTAVQNRLRELDDQPPDIVAHRLITAAIQNTPKIMFLLLPVYALILKLLYIRRKRYYVEHFIFALHIHAFAFLLFFVMMILRNVQMVPTLLILWMLLYSLLAVKRVYRQGWIKTTLKWSVVGVIYSVLVSFGVIGAFISALFTV